MPHNYKVNSKLLFSLSEKFGELTLTKLVLFFLAIFLAVKHFFQIISQKSLFPVDKYFLGLDFQVFYNAGEKLIIFGDPYSIERFVTPPLSAFIMVPFTLIDFNLAKYVFLAINMILLILCFLLVLKMNKRELSISSFFIFLTISFLSYPFIFLIDRGNIDLIVIFFTLSSFFILRDHPIISGIILSVAFGLKIYPIIFLFPLLILHKYKTLVSFFVTISFFLVLTPSLWIQYFFDRIIFRVQAIRYDENGSFFSLFFVPLKALAKVISYQNEFILIIVSLILLIVIFGYLIYKISTREKSNTNLDKNYLMITYMPFIFFFPMVVYLYQYVFILFLIPYLESRLSEDSSQNKFYILLFSLLISLTQFPVYEFSQFFNFKPLTMMVNLISPVSAFILLTLLISPGALYSKNRITISRSMFL
ncbi:MAG: glycosyltransferase family 87 protein [Ignavibacteriaceae bacterium]|jgi:hypothetical protein|nr:glycosyltransferase family 87 protein [Ignavibacteriaceae bacterium]